jgi:cytoskeletal protein RodZ
MSSEDANSHTNLEIGRMLERARAERGLSLWQVEDATKIRARYLHDLERENFDVLPAVYVLGSLKTYADFLGLDGEALSRELKNRQEPPPEEGDPTLEEPAHSEGGGILATLGSLPVIWGREAGEDDEGATPAAVLGYGPRLYLGLGAVLILVLAVALGTAFGNGGQPEVSQVREPAVSEAPSRIAFSGDAQDGRIDERTQDAGDKDDRPEEQAESPDDEKDEKDEKDKAGESDKDDTRPEDPGNVAATLPTSTTASASASASASATAPATSASAATAAPASAPSATAAPAATAAPETADPAPTQPASRPAPAAAGSPGGSRQAEPGSVNRSPLAVRIVREVRSATSGAR